MRKVFVSCVLVLCVSMVGVLSACTSAKDYLKSIDMSAYDNKIDDAIPQTDITKYVENYLNSGVGKRAILILVDGFRANTLDLFLDYELGIARLKNLGGLYFTKPMNIDTKSKIGVGTNMMSILTAEEPSAISLYKSTDAKRAEPYTIMSKVAKDKKVVYLTDNYNYIDVQLKQEFEENKNNKNLKYEYVEEFENIDDKVIENLNNNLIVVSISGVNSSASGKYSAKNANYINAIHNLNSMIENIWQSTRDIFGDYMIMVASTFGGEESLTQNKEAHNTTTFLACNKELL